MKQQDLKFVLFTNDPSLEQKIRSNVSKVGPSGGELGIVKTPEDRSILLAPDGLFYGPSEMDSYFGALLRA